MRRKYINPLKARLDGDKMIAVLELLQQRVTQSGGRPESIMEHEIATILDNHRVEYQCQYPIGRYRADFAVPSLCVIIEYDGREFHQDRTRDDLRDSELQGRGWTTYRISRGSRLQGFVVRTGVSDVASSRELRECICTFLRLICLADEEHKVGCCEFVPREGIQ